MISGWIVKAGNAVALVLAVLLTGLIGVATLLFWTWLNKPEGEIVKRFRSQAPYSAQAKDITHLIAPLLPVGFSEQQATELLDGSGFRCSRPDSTAPFAELACERISGSMVCSDHWFIDIGLAENRTISSRKAYAWAHCL
jgi:hypothetical protein